MPVELAVNLPGMTPSDKVMATGTIVEPIAPAVAEKIAAEDFSLVAANYRTQIYRFLLSSTRDVDLAETLTSHPAWRRLCLARARRGPRRRGLRRFRRIGAVRNVGVVKGSHSSVSLSASLSRCR